MKKSKIKNVTDEIANLFVTKLAEAHYDAGMNNDSISRSVFRAVWEGSGDVMKAVAAASLSIGDKHGPLAQARALIISFESDPDYTYNTMRNAINEGVKIPGFGNSFFHEGIDPSFEEVYNLYSEQFYKIKGKENSVNLLWKAFSRLKYGRELDYGEKGVYPNAALITGGIVELLKGVPYIEYWLFINGRTRAWIESLSV